MDAKRIMGEGFIGCAEIESKAGAMNLAADGNYTLEKYPIPFTQARLEQFKNTHILFFVIPIHKDGTPVTILSLRNIFGTDPSVMEPCFYNQDWYLKEKFVHQQLEAGWFLLSRALLDTTRGKRVDEIKSLSQTEVNFPTAVLCTYFFFLSYLVFGRPVWKNDYIWNVDTDNQGDQIYTGRYIDPSGTNKNGWEIHRHLSIKQNYGALHLIGSNMKLDQ